ncbi:hypothetical protein BHE74_00018643 [Ensete ventricosum]|nr:hypothetical protein BHE74_00018643 [Ensete ventricosum]
MTVINYAQSRVSISFSHTVSKFQNTGHSQHISSWEVVRAWFREKMRLSSALCKVEFRSIFRAPFQNFKILAIPNLLAHGNSYERCFMKKMRWS